MEACIAIYSLNMRSVGRSTHSARTAGAHVRYITRPKAQADFFGERMPTTPKAARAWIDAQERGDRKNARVIDKIMAALPIELDAAQKQALVRAFAKTLTKDRAAWVAAIHQAGADRHNPHVHLVIRDRDPETGKRVAQLSDKGACERVRRLWEEMANEALRKAGERARIDRRSYAARDTDKRAQRHRGAYQWRTLPYGQFADAARQTGRLGLVADEADELVAAITVDDHVVLGQGLMRDNALQSDAKVAQSPRKAGTGEEGLHAEADSGIVGLVGHGLTGEAVEPTLDAAGQLEVVGMHGEDLTLPEDGVEQPWWQLDLPRSGGVRFPVWRIRGHEASTVIPLRHPVPRKPVKTCLTTLFGLVFETNISHDQRSTQASDRPPKLLVVPSTSRAFHLAQGIVWRKADARRRLKALFDRVVQVRGGKNDQIPIPDRRNAELSRGVNGNADLGIAELYRLGAPLLQGEERVLHDVAIIPERRLEGADGKHVELRRFH